MTFFDPECTPNSTSLPEDESRHAIKSLRLRIGESFKVINGQGLILSAKMTNNSDGEVQYDVLSFEERKKPNIKLHIAISPLKQTDRFEYFIEKACELGVNEITPINTQRTEKMRLKEERLIRIIISALKQSGNPFLPILHPITSFQTFIEQKNSPLKFIAHCMENNKTAISTINFNQDTVFLIGPEGDFNESELDLALNLGFQPISMGEYTLRTETAALTACAYFQMQQLK